MLATSQVKKFFKKIKLQRVYEVKGKLEKGKIKYQLQYCNTAQYQDPTCLKYEKSAS